MSAFFAMETTADGVQLLHVFKGKGALEARNNWTFGRLATLASHIPTSRAFAREREVEAYVGDLIVHDTDRGVEYRMTERAG